MKSLFDKSHALLFGMLGALIIIFIVELITPAPTVIATVDITRITQDFIKDKKQHDLSKEAFKKEVELFGSALERTIKHFADKNHVAILPKEAVMAGSQDYTHDIVMAMEKAMFLEKNMT